MEITVTITTRGRYFTTLPMCLMSVLNQSFLPKRVILVDDNDKKEFQQLDIFKYITFLFKQKNIKFDYYHGDSKGQVYAQQIALDKVDTKWIFKLDDDNILEYNVLETLMKTTTKFTQDKIGAISCLILTQKDVERKLDYKSDIYNKMEDIYNLFNIQMIKNQSNDIKLVEHLHGCYLFKREIVDKYSLDFSPSGHREDTVFTHEIFLKGYKLLVNPNCIIWHMKEEKGGNRLHDDGNKNELLFIDKLKEWKIMPDKILIKEDNEKIITIKNGNEYLVLKKIIN